MATCDWNIFLIVIFSSKVALVLVTIRILKQISKRKTPLQLAIQMPFTLSPIETVLYVPSATWIVKKKVQKNGLHIHCGLVSSSRRKKPYWLFFVTQHYSQPSIISHQFFFNKSIKRHKRVMRRIEAPKGQISTKKTKTPFWEIYLRKGEIYQHVITTVVPVKTSVCYDLSFNVIQSNVALTTAYNNLRCG